MAVTPRPQEERAVTRFTGLFTALVTPFRDGGLDESAFTELAERQIAAGVQGLVVASGVAGEAATLRPDETQRLIELCVRAAAGRVLVIAGAASNATAATVELVRQAQDLGADAALVTAPWYNRPSQEGIFRHYQALTEAVAFPILVGNVPSRTAIDISLETLQRLARMPGIVGLEDGAGDITRISAMRQDCRGWAVLSSHDPSGLGHLAYGGHGLISLTANVAPAAMSALSAACRADDWATAREWQNRLFRLHAALMLDPAPAAAKLALSLLGLCRPDVRLPITAGSESISRALQQAMEESGVPARY